MNLFLVIMYRYGNKKGHSYVIGCTRNYTYASIIGKQEESNRGGKYDMEIEIIQIKNKNIQKIYHVYEKINNNTFNEYFIHHFFENENEAIKHSSLNGSEIHELLISDDIDHEDLFEYHQYMPNYTQKQWEYLKDQSFKYIKEEKERTLLREVIQNTTSSETLQFYLQNKKYNYLEADICSNICIDQQNLDSISHFSTEMVQNLLNNPNVSMDFIKKIYLDNPEKLTLINCLLDHSKIDRDFLKLIFEQASECLLFPRPKKALIHHVNMDSILLWEIYLKMPDWSEEITKNPKFNQVANVILNKIKNPKLE